ncbi:MAG: gamma-glutamylcyclotransferase [Alphaproteobacteria bacterium]|nr:gamma-glutamylcyclotransferase [Alphaproteobacteria bacterium]
MTDLFVYGTLMRGHVQGGLLKRFEVTQATTTGRMYRLPAGYPALQPGPVGVVHGELVRSVDARTLSLLDQYEGLDEGLYERIEIDIVTGLRTYGAQAYVMRDPERLGGILVPSGRWAAAIRR